MPFLFALGLYFLPAVLTTQRLAANRFSQYFLQSKYGHQCGAVKKICHVSWRRRRSKRMNSNLVLLIFKRRIKWKFLFNRIPKAALLRDLMNHGMCQRWQVLQTAKRGWTQSWSSVVKVMRLVAFQPVRIPLSGEEENSKNVYSPSIFLTLHPHSCQVSRFALASSSLAILSARSTIEQQY